MAKRASAKQKAWRAKFAQLYGKKKGRTRARARSSTSVKHMARRKSTRRAGARGLLGGGMVRKALMGAGAASVAGIVIGENALLRAAVGFVAGDIPGAVAAYALPNIKFGGLAIPGLASTPATGSTYL